MNDIEARRKAYARVNRYIILHRDTLVSGGNRPDTLWVNLQAYYGQPMKDWSMARWEAVEKAVKDEVEIIQNKERRFWQGKL